MKSTVNTTAARPSGLKSVKAKWPALCVICGQDIEVGEDIAPLANRWDHHHPCLEAQLEQQRNVEAINSGSTYAAASRPWKRARGPRA